MNFQVPSKEEFFIVGRLSASENDFCSTKWGIYQTEKEFSGVFQCSSILYTPSD
jgi:hypothetical protein